MDWGARTAARAARRGLETRQRRCEPAPCAAVPPSLPDRVPAHPPLPAGPSSSDPACRLERTTRSGASRTPPADQCAAQAPTNDFVALVEHSMFKGHDSGLRPRAAVFEFRDGGLAAQRIADENRTGHDHLVVTQVGDQYAQRRLRYRYADHQAERENAVHQDLPELAFGRRLCIEMQRLWVVRERRDEQIVRFRHCAPDLVFDSIAHFPVFVESPRHQDGLAERPPTMRTSVTFSATWSPTETASSPTVPSKGAMSECSIFMASSEMSV